MSTWVINFTEKLMKMCVLFSNATIAVKEELNIRLYSHCDTFFSLNPLSFKSSKRRPCIKFAYSTPSGASLYSSVFH